jgi:hypothetical protein
MATNNAINLKGPNPAFSAYLSVDAANAAGGGAWYNPICDTVLVNNGSCYNAGTGIFTASITGTYVFGVTATFAGFTGGATNIFLQPVVSPTGVAYAFDAQITSSAATNYNNWIILSGEMMVNLAAGEFVQIYVMADGTRTITSIGANGGGPRPTRFYGYYIPTY